MDHMELHKNYYTNKIRNLAKSKGIELLISNTDEDVEQKLKEYDNGLFDKIIEFKSASLEVTEFYIKKEANDKSTKVENIKIFLIGKRDAAEREIV